MKIAITAILIIILFPSFVFSGEIYGYIKNGKKVFGKDKNIEIKIIPNCNTEKEYSNFMDEFNTYRLYINEKGMCRLKLYVVYGEENEEQKKQIGEEKAVYSYENSVRYDLLIKKEGDGKYSLWRK